MLSKQSRKVFALAFIFFVNFYFYFYSILNGNNLNNEKVESFHKFLELKNILDDEEFLENPKSRKIFFIESQLERERGLSSRQACSVESAGKKFNFLSIFKFIS